MEVSQENPSYDFCGNTGHTKPACRSNKAKTMAFAKKETKDKNAQWKQEKSEQAQSLSAAASASSKKQESSEDEDEFDKKAFMNSFINSWTTSQKNKKSQLNKRKRSDNDTSVSEENYLQYFKLVDLKP
jgi:hypothetical protein